MTGMTLDLPDDYDENIQEIVRPVGPWRFLTSFENLAEGDLFRCVYVESNETDGVYDYNWSKVNSVDGYPEQPYRTLKNFEVMRAVDETSHTVPMFNKKGER